MARTVETEASGVDLSVIDTLQQQRQDKFEEASKLDDALIAVFVRAKHAVAEAELLERAEEKYTEEFGDTPSHRTSNGRRSRRAGGGRKPRPDSDASKILDLLRKNGGRMDSGKLAEIARTKFKVEYPHSVFQSLKKRKSGERLELENGFAVIVKN